MYSTKQSFIKRLSSLAASVLVLFQIVTPLSVFAVDGGYSAQLTSPVSPSKTYTWEVTGSKPGPGQEISHLVISGCWDRSKVSVLSATAGSPEIKDDGSLKIDSLQDIDLPITITVTFTQTYAPLGNASLLVKTGSGSDSGFTYPVTGPDCQALGKLEVNKLIDEDGDGIYESSEASAFGWNTNNGSEYYTMGSTQYLAIGSVNVYEKPVDGYKLTGWFNTNDGTACTDLSALGQDNSARVTNIRSDSTRKITLCNQKIITPPLEGTITVYKETLPEGSNQNFTVAISGTGVISDSTEASISTLEPAVFKVGEGVYSVDEKNLPDGWKQKSNNCKDISISENKLEASCTIINEKSSSLVIAKTANPTGETAFNFLLDEEPFVLIDDDSNSEQAQKTFSDIKPGTYVITEKPLEGWELEDIICQGANNENIQINLDENNVSVTIDYGQDVACEFVNEELKEESLVYGYKYEDVNGNQEWDENETGIKDWSISLLREQCDQFDERVISLAFFNEIDQECDYVEIANTTTDKDGYYSFELTDLYGSYLVCEEQVAGWIQTAPGNNDCYQFFVEGTGNYGAYNFGNKREPSIVIQVTPVCQNNFPYANWSVTPLYFTPTQFKLDWITISGNAAGTPAGTVAASETFNATDVTFDPDTNTYSGVVLWPGTSLTQPDWPGWELVNGLWVENPNDLGGNLRDAALLQISVNPTSSSILAYPEATPNCDPNPTNPQVLGASTSTPATLANTGSSMIQAIFVGVTIIGAASGVTYFSRKKQYS